MNKRFTWKIQDNRGFIYDKITGKEWKKNKQLVHLLNTIWESRGAVIKQNEKLENENRRLKQKEKEFDMVLKSYRDYYKKDISAAEWYGFVGRCYE